MNYVYYCFVPIEYETDTNTARTNTEISNALRNRSASGIAAAASTGSIGDPFPVFS